MLAEGPGGAGDAVAARRARRSSRGAAAIDLPSRVADNLFWLGRHVERAEGAARLLRSIFTRLISESAPGRSAPS